MKEMSWKCISCIPSELQLAGTLNGGQSFRWKHDTETNEWTGVFSSTLWKLLQTDKEIKFQVLGSLKTSIKSEETRSLAETKKQPNAKVNKTSGVNVDSVVPNEGKYFEDILKSYLRLGVELAPLYEDWSKKDPIFKVAAQKFYGIRMLNQEPVENLFSFICSQNNHISRISTMIEKLCTNYGQKICEYNGNTYYSFPSVESISDAKVENKLRELGFGYRAKFIQQSAAKILEWGDDKWFHSLEKMSYASAKVELIKLNGVGAKVADCICLMSLNHLEALPVDTHVYQIASQNYLPHLRGLKSLTDRVYNEIGDHFRGLYGDKAGWAHTVLFCADLKKFEQTGSKRISNEKSKPKAAKKKKS